MITNISKKIPISQRRTMMTKKNAIAQKENQLGSL